MDWKKEFEKFHAENPHVYIMFKRFAFEVVRAGKDNYAARGIFNRMRWFTEIETNDHASTFKINSNYSPYYSRMFMLDFPHLDGFFRTRVVAGDREEVPERSELSIG